MNIARINQWGVVRISSAKGTTIETIQINLRVAHHAVGQVEAIAQKAADEARLALHLGVVVIDRHKDRFAQ